MSESLKASRAPITIGSIEVDGFMLPDGSYRMSQTQTADCVGLPERNARDFLRSKAIKVLLGEGYTPAISEMQPLASPAPNRSAMIALLSKFSNCPSNWKSWANPMP